MTAIEALTEARERVWDTGMSTETCKAIEEYLYELIAEVRDGR